jgi:neuropeptide FF receptor 2
LRAKNIYGVFVVIALYLVPLIVICGFYFKVIKRLQAAPPGESEASMTAHRTRRGVVKMLLVTIVVFFLSWTPYNILYFLKRIEYDYRSVYK